MRVVTQPADLAATYGCAFVPTMGALHDGHLALMQRAAETGLPVCVSIFVNPTQFAPGEDLERYPRTLEEDLRAAAAIGVECAFVPSVETVYPEGVVQANAHAMALPLPDVATRPGLEDRWRPGHFAGVQLVVSRLFDLVRPGVAVFGEKDWQQLRLVEEMVETARVAEPDRWESLAVLAHPTVRAPDGLALSSRNRYLAEGRRALAPTISRALHLAQSAARIDQAEALMHEVLVEAGFDVDYAVVRDARTLMPVTAFTCPTRGLIAARLGSADARVRLIDNVAIPVRD